MVVVAASAAADYDDDDGVWHGADKNLEVAWY